MIHTLQHMHSNNLILDNIYGLLVVFLSLVGFISLAWLREKLLHGGAPAWLARDQRALDQMRMRETHDSMDLLRIHLEQSSKRSRERAKEPDRYGYIITYYAYKHISLWTVIEKCMA